jgi:ubiquinone/menaquinone biosynthesis C-methylase UbiE
MKLSSSNLKQVAFYNSVTPSYMENDKHAIYTEHIVSYMKTVLCKPRETVLEIGAGQGRFTFALKKIVQKICAIDISTKEIDFLKRTVIAKKIQGITAEVHDALCLSETLPKKQYDHVVGFFVLHHLPHTQMEHVVQTLSYYVKKGGTLSFIENNALSPAHLFAILLRSDMSWEIEKETYTNYIRRFKNGCKKNGFTVTISSVFGFSWPELVARFQWTTKIDAIVSRIPIFRNIICPFVLVSATKK